MTTQHAKSNAREGDGVADSVGLHEQAKQWTLREAIHHNGGAAFFAYTMECIQQPRLTRFDRYDKKTRSVTATWRVDGVDQSSLHAAIEALAPAAGAPR